MTIPERRGALLIQTLESLRAAADAAIELEKITPDDDESAALAYSLSAVACIVLEVDHWPETLEVLAASLGDIVGRHPGIAAEQEV